MSEQSVQRRPARKIQDVEKVVPSWIHVKRIEIGFQLCRGEPEILIGGPYFQITVAEDSETRLKTYLSTIWSKCLADREVEAERPQREHFKPRLLSSRIDWNEEGGHRHGQYPEPECAGAHGA